MTDNQLVVATQQLKKFEVCHSAAFLYLSVTYARKKLHFLGAVSFAPFPLRK